MSLVREPERDLGAAAFHRKRLADVGSAELANAVLDAHYAQSGRSFAEEHDVPPLLEEEHVRTLRAVWLEERDLGLHPYWAERIVVTLERFLPVEQHARTLHALLTGRPRHTIDSAPVQAALKALGEALGEEG